MCIATDKERLAIEPMLVMGVFLLGNILVGSIYCLLGVGFAWSPDSDVKDLSISPFMQPRRRVGGWRGFLYIKKASLFSGASSLSAFLGSK